MVYCNSNFCTGYCLGFVLRVFCVIEIKKDTIEGLLEAAKNTYPKEFFALLGSTRKNNTIDEVIIVPAVYGTQHALVKGGHYPLDFNSVGSVHSHPGPSNKPSRADIHSFPSFGRVHLIISFPFNLENVKAFNVNGKEVELDVVQ